MLPRKIGPLMSHLRRLLSKLSINPPFLVAMSNATVSVFVFADAGFFADDFMLYDLLLRLVGCRLQAFFESRYPPRVSECILHSGAPLIVRLVFRFGQRCRAAFKGALVS